MEKPKLEYPNKNPTSWLRSRRGSLQPFIKKQAIPSQSI
jgi:hypothetical protein